MQLASLRFFGIDPARGPLCLKPLLVAPWAPSCSVSVGPLVCPSRAAARLLLTARSPPTAAPAPRPLPLAVSSLGPRIGGACGSSCVPSQPGFFFLDGLTASTTCLTVHVQHSSCDLVKKKKRERLQGVKHGAHASAFKYEHMM